MIKLSKRDYLGSSERFGFEWEYYSVIEPVYEEQFNRWLPFLTRKDWRGKTFADFGCGMGRNSYWPLKYGARSGIGIDLDQRSLNAAIRNLADFQNFSVKKQSIYDFEHNNKFDYVFSIGVIHHLEHPELALKKMVEATKPGGSVFIWVYGYENNEWIVNFVDPLRKHLFSKIPIALLHILSNLPTLLLWLFLRVKKHKNGYYRLIRNFSFFHLRSIVFDQLLPRIANYWTKEQVIAMMADSGLQDIRIKQVNDVSWASMGIKKPI